MLHAECMHGLMVFAKDAFQLVLNQPEKVLKTSMLKKAIQHLKKLCVAYEQNVDSINLCKDQVMYLSRECFPELFYVSFKALQDLYSRSMSGKVLIGYIGL